MAELAYASLQTTDRLDVTPRRQVLGEKGNKNGV